MQTITNIFNTLWKWLSGIASFLFNLPSMLLKNIQKVITVCVMVLLGTYLWSFPAVKTRVQPVVNTVKRVTAPVATIAAPVINKAKNLAEQAGILAPKPTFFERKNKQISDTWTAIQDFGKNLATKTGETLADIATHPVAVISYFVMAAKGLGYI